MTVVEEKVMVKEGVIMVKGKIVEEKVMVRDLR